MAKKKYVTVREGLLYRPAPPEKEPTPEEVTVESKDPVVSNVPEESKDAESQRLEQYNVEKAMKDIEDQQKSSDLGWFMS